MGWYKKVVLFDNLARDWLYRDGHNGLRVSDRRANW